MLKMNLIDHVFDNMVVDEALVRIVLPEGASNIELEAPYTVARLPDDLHFTYLDVKGRPVVQLKAKNLVENHIQEFKVTTVVTWKFGAPKFCGFFFHDRFVFGSSATTFPG